MTIDRYQILNAKVNKLKQEQDRATGAYEHVMKRLKEDYDVGTIKEGERLHSELLKDLRASEQERDKALDEIEEKFGSVLGG